MNKQFNIGGQAVINGVMIRSKNNYVVAVRKGSKILTKREKIKQRGSISKLPIIRGFFNLLDMLIIGIKSLIWSADISSSETGKISKKELILTFLISITLTLLFFVGLPYFFTLLIGIKEENSPLIFNFIDGTFRIILFLAYLIIISYLKDIKNLFQYHGAEHMAVHCFENKKKLSIKNIKNFPTMHPRCGTSFIIIVLITSIIIFSFLPSVTTYLFPEFIKLAFITKRIILFSIRILMLPLIAGTSYELLKISDKFKKNRIMGIFISPGLWIQKITTKNPNNAQIEVAMNSLKMLLKIESMEKT